MILYLINSTHIHSLSTFSSPAIYHIISLLPLLTHSLNQRHSWSKVCLPWYILPIFSVAPFLKTFLGIYFTIPSHISFFLKHSTVLLVLMSFSSYLLLSLHLHSVSHSKCLYLSVSSIFYLFNSTFSSTEPIFLIKHLLHLFKVSFCDKIWRCYVNFKENWKSLKFSSILFGLFFTLA